VTMTTERPRRSSETEVARWTRLDGRAKATGDFQYGVDLSVPGMLWGNVTRSTIAHGLIRRIDTSRAEALPGVRAVLTGRDVEGIRLGRTVLDEPVLAVDRVRYVGEPVAAVAADTREIAERAASLVEVDYEPLPVVRDAMAALDPSAPDLHPEWPSYRRSPGLVGGRNIQNEASIVRGDVDAQFASAAHVVHGRYTAAHVHQVSLEGRVAIASVEADGSIHVRTSHQYPFGLRQDLATILDRDVNDIRVTVTGVGGGFGGKLYAGVEPLAILLAERTGQPVKVMLNREEELMATSPRMAATIDVATAVDEAGNILARDATLIFDAGAYCESSPAVISIGLMTVAGPYRMNAFRARAVAVYTNKTGCGSMRAPAAPQAVFAGESQIDEIAAELGMDAVAFRLQNALRDGDVSPLGQVVHDVDLSTVITTAAREVGWHPDEIDSGVGLACGMWTTAAGSSTASISLADDGCFELVSGATEIGTGAVQASIALACCEALEVGPDRLRLGSTDTAVAGHDHGAQGSRTAIQAGNAAVLAARDLVREMVAVAADHLGVAVDDVVWEDGQAWCARTGQAVPAAEIARLAEAVGGLVGAGTYTAAAAEPASGVSTTGMVVSVMNIPSYYAHAVRVAVDRHTGQITVRDYVAVHGCGRILDPPYARGQIEGGVVQGLGQALLEELTYAHGMPTNATLVDYKVPTCMDVPPIRTVFVESMTSTGEVTEPKGVGEPAVIPTSAAVANAVAAAVGARLTAIPMTAERCWAALRTMRTETL
jgi:CO/xanthine dehydrogenase Mo-binding subunit